jgi:hypothetical protein
MKKKPTYEGDMVEWVVEEAFVKDKYKHWRHWRWIEMGLEMVAFKVVIAGNTIEVVTLGDAKDALREKESELKRQKRKLR